MATSVKIDFVSDVACPWCIVGLRGLQIALDRLSGEVTAQIRSRPFQLNPTMGQAGQPLREYFANKPGITPEHLSTMRTAVSERAATVGFEISTSDDSRIYNTFDAHRLLYWCRDDEAQIELKLALFKAYFTEGRNVADPEVLLSAVASTGLDIERARQILAGNEFANVVSDEEQNWRSRGITSVPAIVINEHYLISGGQPPDVFEQALRQIAASA